jgi:hypothetical protein
VEEEAKYILLKCSEMNKRRGELVRRDCSMNEDAGDWEVSTCANVTDKRNW